MLVSAPVGRAVRAQRRVFRIGLLTVRQDFGPLEKAFLEALRERDYVVDRNAVLLHRSSSGYAPNALAAAEELVKLEPDVLVGASTSTIRALMRATRTIPIVMAASSDPVATGLVASLAKPGSNVTGMTLLSRELASKRLQILRELVPGAKRIAAVAVQTPELLREAAGRNASDLLAGELQAAAGAMQIEMLIESVGQIEQIAAAFDRFGRERAQGVLVQLSPLTFENRVGIIALAAAHRLPDLYETRTFAEAGGLVSYGPDLAGMYRRAAYFVDRILRGTKPGDLPIEQPDRFELIVNAKTAGALGIAVPPGVTARADEVIR